MRRADSPEPLPGLLVAECARQRRLVQRPRVEPERLGRLVLAGEVGVEHHRVVGRDGAADARADELGERVLLQRGDRARADVRDRGDVEDEPALGELFDECRILDRPEPVADAVGLELVDRGSHRLGPDHLAGVRDRAQARRASSPEGGRERAVRVTGLLASQPDGDDPALAVAGGVVHERVRVLEGRAAGDVRGEAHLDAVQLARELGAAAVALEDRVPRDAAPRALDRREDRLEIDGTVPLRLGRVVDDDLAEVLLGPQAVGGQDPDLDEVVEVAKAVELAQALDGVCGQRLTVPLRDREQRLRLDRRLEMDVQLDLGVRGGVVDTGPRW